MTVHLVRSMNRSTQLPCDLACRRLAFYKSKPRSNRHHSPTPATSGFIVLRVDKDIETQGLTSAATTLLQLGHLDTWRRGRDLNSRTPCEVSSFQDWHVRPLRHPSMQNSLDPERSSFKRDGLYDAVSVSPFLASFGGPNRDPFEKTDDGILRLVSYSLRICSSPPM